MTKVAEETLYEDRLGRQFLHPVITMAEDGSLVLPAEVLKALGVKGGETFTFEVDEADGSVTLFAVGDDDWLHEYLERREGEQGQSREATPDEVDALMRSG